MYSEEELNRAVEDGVLTPAAAQAFREHVAKQRAAPLADAEHFRLLTGFNDIFVVLVGVMLLADAGWLVFEWQGREMPAYLTVLVLSWLLAEYFTHRRHLALPSVIFLLTFVWAAFAAGSHPEWFGAADWRRVDAEGLLAAHWQQHRYQLFMGYACVALAAWAHWRRFRVPAAVAAGAGGLIGTAAFALAEVAHAFLLAWHRPLLLLAGLAVFALAMRGDLTDPERRTRSSDAAFWLHALAALLLAHPFFTMVQDAAGAGIGGHAAVVVVYVAVAAVAVAIDRRVYLVSGVFYMHDAFEEMFVAGLGMDMALAQHAAALLIALLLLLLLVFWQQVRARVMARLPTAWCARLPAFGS